MHQQHPPHTDELPDDDKPEPQPHVGHEHSGDHGHDHGHDHDGEICCRDTVLMINGQATDLARHPLKIEFCGFTLDLSYSAAKERTPGQKRVEHFKDYEIVITGPDKGDPLMGHAPGRLFINGKHIEYIYKPATGEIGHPDMFSVHRSLLDLAHAYIISNPSLADFPSHHH